MLDAQHNSAQDPGSDSSFTFTGDHNAADDWAASIVLAATGRMPRMSVFTGDCYGIYIEPHRLHDMGISCRYEGPVLISHGTDVTWTGTEFVAGGAR